MKRRSEEPAAENDAAVAAIGDPFQECGRDRVVVQDGPDGWGNPRIREFGGMTERPDAVPTGVQHVSPEEAEPELEKKVQIMFPNSADIGILERLQRFFLGDLAAPQRRDLLEDRRHVHPPQRRRRTESKVRSREEWIRRNPPRDPMVRGWFLREN